MLQMHKTIERAILEYNQTFDAGDSPVWDWLITLGILEEAI